MIAGFPGETDADFEELCQFVEAAQLDRLGVFSYSMKRRAGFALDGKDRRRSTIAAVVDGATTQDLRKMNRRHIRSCQC